MINGSVNWRLHISDNLNLVYLGFNFVGFKLL